MEVIEAEVALGGVDGGAGEETDHFVEEAVSGEAEGETVVGVGEEGLGDDAAVVGLFRFVSTLGGEGAEVMRAFHHVECFLKGLGVEETWEVPSPSGGGRRENGKGAEVVGVGLTGGLKTGVEIARDFLAFYDADGGRQLGVERGNPVEGVHGEMARGVEMSDLAESVDSGIGAAGSVEAKGLFGDDGEGFFNALLDGVGIGLNLPTGVGSAVVGDGEFEAHGV